LITPPDEKGLYGDREHQAFNESPSMTPAVLNELCLLICTSLLPAVEGENFNGFSAALYTFGRRVGEYFAPHQGGAVANPRMAALAEQLRTNGIEGVGQTSWGPTLFAVCPTEAVAASVAAEICRSANWSDCAVRVVQGKNDGAQVEAR
jgi:beta-ribofuranosylaminobenzene 5'-phosphate synthase